MSKGGALALVMSRVGVMTRRSGALLLFALQQFKAFVPLNDEEEGEREERTCVRIEAMDANKTSGSIVVPALEEGQGRPYHTQKLPGSDKSNQQGKTSGLQTCPNT
jgi:hypothetical protein